MSGSRAIQVLRRFDAAELALCLYFNRACARPAAREFFGAISRLGDGVAWYVLIFALPFIYPSAGPMPSVRMAMTGIVGVLIYKALKHTLVRERPFIASAAISLGTAPLDRYSFPSGHTLHAASFTTMTVSQFPELGILLLPFATLIAASRVVLGLHYPTDVAAGALLGFGLASVSLTL